MYDVLLAIAIIFAALVVLITFAIAFRHPLKLHIKAGQNQGLELEVGQQGANSQGAANGKSRETEG